MLQKLRVKEKIKDRPIKTFFYLLIDLHGCFGNPAQRPDKTP